MNKVGRFAWAKNSFFPVLRECVASTPLFLHHETTSSTFSFPTKAELKPFVTQSVWHNDFYFTSEYFSISLASSKENNHHTKEAQVSCILQASAW
jgi:hypothetical protein